MRRNTEGSFRLFSRRITPQFEQWINGSFVTTKENPNDIDFVTFIDSTIFKQNEAKLEEFWSFALEDEGLDAYIVKIYPTDSPLFATHIQSISKRFGLKDFVEQKQIPI